MSPSWFPYYCDYLAIGLALCVGAAVSTFAGRPAPKIRSLPPIVLTAGVFVVTSAVTVSGSMATHPFAGAAQLTRAVHNERCVTVTADTVQIRLNALTRGLAAGCPNWIDVTGHRYSLPGEDRAQNDRAWDRTLANYLRSGDAVTLSITPAPNTVARAIKQGGVLARAGGNVIYRGRPWCPTRTVNCSPEPSKRGRFHRAGQAS